MTDKPQYSDSMNLLIDALARLPGIGRRTAERLAFHILRIDTEQAMQLAKAIERVKTNVRHCSNCYNLTEHDPCTICADTRRDPWTIMIVEQPRDVLALEQTGHYRGMYHVLMGHLAPLDGIGPDQLTVQPLQQRVEQLLKSQTDQEIEMILATNPNMEGDGTALFIAQQFQNTQRIKISRLARGLPVGTQLEFANKAVLFDAINARHQF